MKIYKVVKVSSAEAFETSLNELAQAGWKVVSANVTFPVTAENTPVYFALMESFPLETELKHMIEENVADIAEEIDNLGISPSVN